MLEHYVDAGGIALGAFASDQLVGIGVVVPHLRPGIAQLAYLMVSASVRATGIGSRLSEQLDEIARTAGDSDMVVTATPTENTVRFYLGRGFEPMAEPLAELFALEPEDVHMRKVLSAAKRTRPRGVDADVARRSPRRVRATVTSRRCARCSIPTRPGR